MADFARTVGTCALLLLCYAAASLAASFRAFERDFFNAHWTTEETPFNEPAPVVRGIPCEDTQ